MDKTSSGTSSFISECNSTSSLLNMIRLGRMKRIYMWQSMIQLLLLNISEASMNLERFAIIMFAILASSTIKFILIFYGVRNRKKKTSDYVSRNEEEEIGLNMVV